MLMHQKSYLRLYNPLRFDHTVSDVLEATYLVVFLFGSCVAYFSSADIIDDAEFIFFFKLFLVAVVVTIIFLFLFLLLHNAPQRRCAR